MTQLSITIKCFEQYYLTNTIILLKKLHFLFISKNKKSIEKKKNFYLTSSASVAELAKQNLQQKYEQKKLTLKSYFGKIKNETPKLKNGNLRFFKAISLPKKRKLFTVLRSPHIDKKSREQFEFKSYKKKLFFNSMDYDIKKCFTPLLIFLIKNAEFPGVELEICFSYSTILKKN